MGSLLTSFSPSCAAAAVGDPGVEGAEPPHHAAPYKAALIVGLNYAGTPAELGGCIHDACLHAAWAVRVLGVPPAAVTVCLEGSPAQLAAATGELPQGVRLGPLPSRAALRRELAAAHARAAGSRLLFTYSGHGSWVPEGGPAACPSRDEADGRDETLCLTDGQLTDDELATLLAPPAGPRVAAAVTAVLDCCHSGTGTDAPATAAWVRGRTRATSVTGRLELRAPSFAQVAAWAGRVPLVALSACADAQTAADAWNDGRRRFEGALTTALHEVLAAGRAGVSQDRPLLELAAAAATAEQGDAMAPRARGTTASDAARRERLLGGPAAATATTPQWTTSTLLEALHAALTAGGYTQTPRLGASRKLSADVTLPLW